MANCEVRQRLAAILAADAAGYTRLMADDEQATIAALDDARAVFRDHAAANNGRVVDTAGDSVLAVFETAAGAIEAALAIQNRLAFLVEDDPESRQLRFRIGVHLGDINEKSDGTIYGDGVNIAARLESLAEPGEITVSDAVHVALRGRVEASFRDLGEHQVKNVAEPVRAYHVTAGHGGAQEAGHRAFGTMTLTVAAAFVLVSLGVVIWALVDHLQRPGAGTSAPPQMAIPKDVLALPSGPSIAVLPFDNLGGEPDQAYFAEGLAGDISVQLSFEPNLKVIGRSSTQKYQSENKDIREIAGELDVQYILRGTVRRSAQTIRLSCELLDGADGSQIWAQTFDRHLTTANVFAVQDEIARQVIGILSDEYGIISQIVRKDAAARDIVELNSYECVLLGYDFLVRHTQESHSRARDCLEETVKKDPMYADAWGILAILYAQELVNGFNPLPESLKRSLDAAERGVKADDNSQIAWQGLAAAYYHNHERGKFMAAAEKALTINPNDVSTLGILGFYYGTWGMWDIALPLLEKAIALSPFDVFWYYGPLVLEAYHRQDYESALEYAHKFNLPGWNWTYILYVPTYAQLGQLEKAQQELDQLLELEPNFANEFRMHGRFWNFPEPLIEHMVDGFRKAGLDIPDEPVPTD